MRSAKLFILGEERELLWTYMDYYKHIAADGSPTSNLEGGLLRLCFVSQESDDVFWHNMVKKVDKETERMEKGEIHFYSKGDEDITIRKYKFSDAYLIELSETFYAYGTENMQTVLTISPAIQNYGFEHDLVKHWQVSKITTAPVYYTPKKEKKQTRVKTIQLVTSLDFGSSNDGSGTGGQKGMLYGKEYEFRVTEYTEETPDDKSQIKWAIKYHSLSQNKWIEKYSSVTGDTLKFFLNEKDMCGCFVYFRAYIQDAESEGELKVWKHNRFRWFDRMIVEKEIKERTDQNEPWRVDQNGTSLCGMACVFYRFAKKQPESYKKFAKELFRTGEATFNTYTVKPSIEILEKKPNIKGYPFNNVYMPLVDYITLAGTRNTDNPNYKGGDEEFQAINWPPIMHNLCKNLLGYNDVSSKGVYNPVSPLPYTTSDIEIKIDDINNQIKAGYKLILMIDSDLIEDNWDYNSLDLHWVVLESPITWNYTPKFLGAKIDEIDFRVYSWGTNPFGTNRYLKKKITSSHFMNNYNGYIKIK
ncbi:type VI secretion system tube protein TssD [Flavobacterium pectinovorum]|uniref:type VI secretion system tube protein TssD n=1 Tax=Flavobacterium pectinovorum TaxID=29533 RepID=UPI00265FF3FD|nr:type VI secretion system tube protein TssD [Flavobacterium pectinovorum]WKL48584.1 type VI secretion system tube protein TssD [Flavobacterium pectinovorum]